MADETKPAPASTDTSAGERRPPRSGPGGGREGGPGGQGGRKFFRRKKVCKFCTEKIEAINYKDVRLLAQFVAESGKIVPRFDTLLDLVRVLDFDLLLVPRTLVPVVQSLIRQDRDPEGSLYADA